MRIYFLAASVVLAAVAACTSDDTNPSAPGGDAGGPIAETPDGSSTPSDAAPGDVGDAGGDGACPASWTAAQAVDPSLAVPTDGGSVIFHGAATGTQNYTCESSVDGGATTYGWVFVGPEADLADCTETKVAKHFASNGNAAAPEWQTTDGTYVIAKKVAGFTPDGGASSVPWLLLATTSTNGTGLISKTAYVQRLNTDGGVAPTSSCGSGNVGTTEKVPYTADYYFSGTR